MAEFGLTNTPLIRDLYNTAEEALTAAIRLNVNGYRTYNVNGITKYVPGATYLEYEKAVQLVKVQGKIAARGDEVFGDKLVGLQFANSKTEIKGDPLLTFGNFSITTATKQSFTTPVVNNDQPKTYTAQNITDKIVEAGEAVGIEVNSSMLVDDIVDRIEENARVKINFDKRKLENYVLFSSLKERIRQSIQEIIQRFPAALHVVPVSIVYPTIAKCEEIRNDNQTVLTLNASTISNPFNIEYLKDDINKVTEEGITNIRNFSKTYDQYVVVYNDIEYPIINAILPKTTEDNLKIVINGQPFTSLLNSNQTLNVELYIKPNKKNYTLFYDNLSDLAGFLLNVNGVGGYVANIFVPTEMDNGEVINQVNSVSFPMVDQYNIDISGEAFDEYLNKLNEISEDFDRFKTNLIARFLTTESLQEFDTEDRKFNIVLQVYGRMFDQVKQYIDGLTYMRTVTYDKIENVPDALVKNFARMLGFKTFEIQDEDTLVKSLFNFEESELEGDLTPAELDIEIWRRILVNAFYLFKNKGTRKSIEFILELIGVPEPIIEINEYVYLADHKLNPEDINKALFGDYSLEFDGDNFYPYDNEGYPTTPKNVHFQANGGNLRIDSSNIGPYDFGKKYIKQYKKFEDGVFGFSLYRTIDNQKSWVKVSEEINRENVQDLRHTNYIEKDSRLTINSKELDVYIALDRIFDVYPYRYFFKNNIDINSDISSVYKTATIVKDQTFDQYLTKILNNYVNVRNRKTIQTYPTLSKIYFDYLQLLGNSESYINFRKSMEFINKFDSYWIKFIEQFIPATTIVNAGKKIDNSIHFQNKFKYRHGKNVDVDWKGTDGSEYQNLALKPVSFGNVQAGSTTGYKHPSLYGDINHFEISGIANRKYVAHYKAVKDYLGIHYSIADYCELKANVQVWEPNIEYNSSTYQFGRLGVFIIYKNKLYRLYSPSFLPSGTTTNNVYPDSDPSIFLEIDDHMDANTVQFPDVPNTTITERNYFVNTIGFALAYKLLDADFDCPPPRPHVCYFDFYGRDLIFSITGGTMQTVTTDAIEPTSGTASVVKTTKLTTNGTSGTYLMAPGYTTYGGGSVEYHLTADNLWRNPVTFTIVGGIPIPMGGLEGRLNKVGVWTGASTSTPIDEWIGFTKKLNFPLAKRIYIGMSAYNKVRLKLNGVKILELDNQGALYGNNHLNNYWMIYPVDVQAGDNYFEMEGAHEVFMSPQPATMGFEIYDNTAAELASAVNESQLTILYSTLNEVGDTFDLGTTIGYSCPPDQGWFLDNSTGSPVCRKLDTFFVPTGSTLNDSFNYYDNLGGLLKVRQPLYYGYSLNSDNNRPAHTHYGTKNKWAIDYHPKMIWTTGTTYYKNEVVTYNDVNYLMTGTTIATTTTITGGTITNIHPGLYQQFQNRIKSDPFMHIQPAYLDVLIADPSLGKISINLTKDFNLYHIFSGATQDTTYRVTDNIIEESLFISDSITIGFDGLYPIDPNRLGPAYSVNNDNSFANTVNDTLTLKPDVLNYVDLRSLGTGFTNNSVNFNLSEQLPGYYLVNNTSFLTFKFDLYFESDFRGNQEVKVAVVNQNGNVINQETFRFNSDSNENDRTMHFVSQSVFLANQRLYLAITPVLHPCRLVRFEKLEFDYNDKIGNNTTYYEMYDARFRVNFNGGRSINENYLYDPLISISPVANLLDVDTMYYTAEDDVININSSSQSRIRNYNEIEYRQNTALQYTFNKLYGEYYKKYTTNSKQNLLSSETRFALDRELGYNKIDFNFNFQTRKLPDNFDARSKSIKGDTVQVTVSVTDMYLGNTIINQENGQATKNIVVGVSPKLREIALNKSLGVIDVSDNTLKNIDLYGYSYGLSDYGNLNYKNKDEFYDLNYFKLPDESVFKPYVSGHYYNDSDNPIPSTSVRNSKLYKSVLEKAEFFDVRIKNYKINDVVKITDPFTKQDILYVCVRDVETYHTSSTEGILSVYRIGGDKSLFVELTKYNLKNYEISGYQKTAPKYATKTNIKDYRDDNIIITADSGAVSILDIKPGEIIKYGNGANVRYHKLVYNKSLKYDPNSLYNLGDYILYNLKFYVCSTAYAGLGASDPTTTGCFTEIDPISSSNWDSDYFDTSVPYQGPDQYDLVSTNANESYEITYSPNAILLVSLTLGATFQIGDKVSIDGGPQYTVNMLVQGGNIWNVGLVESPMWVSQTTGTIRIYRKVVTNDTVKIYYNAVKLPDPSLIVDDKLYWYPAKKFNSEYFTAYAYRINSATEVPNGMLYYTDTAFDLSKSQGAWPVSTPNWVTYYNQTVNSYMPLFEVTEGLVDLPLDYDSQKLYGIMPSTSLQDSLGHKMSDNKVLFKNKLYNYIGSVATGWTGTLDINPATDSNWEAKDFMLVEKITFYKERTRVRVYDGNVVSLTSDMRENFLMFDKDLNYKTGYSPNNIASTHQVGDKVNGKTITYLDVINEQLENGLNLVNTVKDKNRRYVKKYGDWGLRRQQNDLILDYFYAPDRLGVLSVTGEFAGLLHVSNPCGHSAAVVFGVILANKANSLQLIKPRQLDVVTLEPPALTTNYTFRMIFNQTGRATATISWSGAATGSVVISENHNYDDVLVLEPNQELIVTMSYNVGNKQSKFGYANLDDLDLYPDPTLFENRLFKNHLVQAGAQFDDNTRTEIRTIVISSIDRNHVLQLGVTGIEKPGFDDNVNFTNIINLD